MEGDKTNSTVAKFLLGFIGGLCAVFMPRLAALLGSGGNDNVTLFTNKFVLLGFVFAILIGSISAIFEFRIAKAPKETFMAALGIPALLAGALNTTAPVAEMSKLKQENIALAGKLADAHDVTTESTESFTFIEPQAEPAPVNQPGAFLRLLGVSDAFAANNDNTIDGSEDEGWGSAGIETTDSPHYVVLGRSNSLEKAKKELETLRPSFSTAAIASLGKNSFVILLPNKRSQSDAIAEAARIRKENHINASVLEVK